MSAAEPQPGHFPDRVGKYELLLPIGTGATATVFLARTRGVAGFEREVALKLVHAHLRADEESKLHLLDEARLAARIRHPNVVPVIEVESDPFGVFLVMDYVEGDTLSGLVRILRERNQRLPPRLAARIMNDALAGLHAAHELRDSDGQFVGLVHRDFSPQNILVGVEGVTRLADFGVAKAASRAVRTKTGLVKGKIAYMSPEQARGHRLDRRCDVWAAGVVVWELITGRRLYEHEDEVATLLSIVTQDPPRLRDVIRGVPSAIEEAVSYALTSDLNARCPSAEALRSLLEAAWQDIGGMASTAEVAAFVRATVGGKLNERRALAARPRPVPATAAEAAAGVLQAPSLRPTSAPPRDEATKTAISAAVPAAALRGPASGRRRLWRERTLLIGGAVTVLSLVALALPLLTSSAPGTGAPGAAGVATPDTTLAREGAGAAEKPSAAHASKLVPSAPERDEASEPSSAAKRVSGSVAAALSGAERTSRSAQAGDENDDEASDARPRSGTKSGARKGDGTSRKTAQQRKSRTKRTSTQSAANEEAEVRTEKKAKPSKAANPTTPVRLAPDPYQLDN